MSRKINETPQGLELRPKPKVLGMSRTPMIIAGVMLGAILLVYVAIMANKSTQGDDGQGPAKILVDRNVPSRGIANATGEFGIIQAGIPPDQPAFEQGNVKIERPDVEEPSEQPRIVTVVIPKETPDSRHDEQDAMEQDDIRRMQMESMRNAIRAPMNTGIKVNVASASGASGQAASYGYTAPTAPSDFDADKMTAHLRGEYSPELQARLDAAGMAGSGLAGGVDFFGAGGAAPANLSSATDRDWQLGFQRKAGRTYELKTGTVLSGVLITGINSDLAGAVTAQVSQPVFDSTTGKHLLIPQGSRLYGDYASSVAFGQSRLFVSWKRIIFPDGSSMTIGDMRGSDQAGYSGFADKVDNHYLRMFGATLFMSAITAGTTYSVDRLNRDNGSSDEDGSSMRDEMAMALAQQMGQVSMNLLQKHLNVSPTIEIRPGYKFSIVATKDVVFDAAYEPLPTVR